MEMVSHREYRTRAILKTIDRTNPSLTDFYIMQLTQVMAGNKNSKLKDFLLTTNDSSRFTKEERDQHDKNVQAFTEAQWRTRLGPNSGFKYTPPPSEEE